MNFSPAVGLLLCLLPFCGLAFGVVAFRLRGEKWRSAIIASATCNAVYIAFTIEALSVFQFVTRPGFIGAWVIFDVVSLLYVRHLYSKAGRVSSKDLTNGTGQNVLGRSDIYLLAGAFLVVGLVGLTAILAPPNTLDVVAYHLPRVAIWAINKDVWNYPAFESQQLFLSPWAEYAILHLYALSGSDYLSNLVEWFSMIGLILSVSLIAERLGAGVRGQIFAAVSCAAMPGLVLEASGSMNTCVGAFWIAVCVYYFLRANDERNWGSSAGAASAAGLAIFTKGTSYIFLPFLMLSCWLAGDAESRKFWLRQIPVFVLMVLLLNGPMCIRNYNLSGSPIGFAMASGADVQRQYANSKHSAGVTYANVIRNAALHLGTPIQAVNNRVEAITRRAISIFGIDPDDPDSTARGGFTVPALTAHESSAGSFFQFILIVVALCLLLSKRYGDPKLRWIGLGVCLSFILFCAMIRWTQWNARYVLPLICVGLSFAAVVVERALPKAVTVLMAAGLLIFAVPFALQNTIRPLAPWKVTSLFRRPRLDFYFEEWQQSLEPSYKFAVAQIKRSSCRDIGIDSALEDVEYPLMAMLRQISNDTAFRFYRMQNASSRYERIHHPPCAVICLRCARIPAKWAEYQNIGGKVSTFDEIAIFSGDGDQDNRQTLTVPQPFDPWVMAKELDVARDAVSYSIFAPETHSGLSTTIFRVVQAGKDWPEKAIDLQAHLHGVESLSLKAWRARDSVDPMLRRGQKLDYSDADPFQFMAVSEILDNWKNEAPGRIREVNDLVDQLYTSWEIRLTETPGALAETSNACRVQAKKLVTSSGQRASLSSDESVQLQNCSCLGSHPSIGRVIEQKRQGIYDSEATVATGCKILDVH
jgi:hypothetical protein